MSTRSMYAEQEDDEVSVGRGGAMPQIPKDIINQFVTGPMSAESVESNSLACWRRPKTEPL